MVGFHVVYGVEEVKGLRGNQGYDELYAVVRESESTQHEHRATFLRERIGRPDDVTAFQLFERSHCISSISSVWRSSRRSSPYWSSAAS